MCSGPMNTSDMSPLSALAGRLDYNNIGFEGAKAIAAVLKDSQLSTLGCAATPNLHSACTRHTPLTLSINSVQSRKHQSGWRDGLRQEE